MSPQSVPTTPAGSEYTSMFVSPTGAPVNGLMKASPRRPHAASPAVVGRKRSAAEYESDDDVSPRKAKKTKAAKKAKTAAAPTEELSLFAMGIGHQNRLVTIPSAVNPTLVSDFDPTAADKPHLVDVASGLKHSVAISTDNKIFTWGIDTNSCIGRAVPDADSYTPGQVIGFAANDVFVQAAATNSASFVLTATGYVYGWGSFICERPEAAMGLDVGTPHFQQIIRSRLARAETEDPKPKQYDNKFGYDANGKLVSVQATPVLIPGLSNIVQLVAGANHVLALDNGGNVWSWGCNDRGQLGRPCYGRRRHDPLVPHMLHVCRGTTKTLGTGMNHSFIIDNKDNVWAWGENVHCETGCTKNLFSDDEFIEVPTKVSSLCKRKIVTVTGGLMHSVAINEAGSVFIWGNPADGACGVRLTDCQMRDSRQVRMHPEGGPICIKPRHIDLAGKGAMQSAYCGIEATYLINKAGKVFSTGFNYGGQLGLGHKRAVWAFEAIPSSDLAGKRALYVAVGDAYAFICTKS